MKILFFATHPEQPIGYAKMAYRISNYLADQPDIDLYYYAISNFPGQGVTRQIHPKIKIIDALAESQKRGENDAFAIHLADEILRLVNPDIFLIYNDILVTCRLIQALQKYRQDHQNTKFVSYIDLVYPFEQPRYIRMLDQNTDMILTFSEYWKQNLMDMGVSEQKIQIFHHGIDPTLVFRSNPMEGRTFLHFRADDFIVLNINRNQYRKAHDIALRAFLTFLQRENMNPRIKLFVNFAFQSSSGYDFMELIRVECLKLGLPTETVMTQHIFHMASNVGKVEDATINMLYNMADVGINSCVGEGFGLCNAEHASVGKPQIISAVGGLRDIFAGEPNMLVEPRAVLAIANHVEDTLGDLHICDASDFADRLQYYFHNPAARFEEGERIAAHLRQKYNWDHILPRMLQNLRSAIGCA